MFKKGSFYLILLWPRCVSPLKVWQLTSVMKIIVLLVGDGELQEPDGFHLSFLSEGGGLVVEHWECCFWVNELCYALRAMRRIIYAPKSPSFLHLPLVELYKKTHRKCPSCGGVQSSVKNCKKKAILNLRIPAISTLCDSLYWHIYHSYCSVLMR